MNQMKLKKLLCAGLSGVLTAGLLAGCAGTGEPEATPDPGDIAYQAAGITRDTVLYTVDGTEVPADEYLFWLLTSISTAKQSGYLADDTAWEEEIDGTPTADYLKNDALETSKLYALVELKAAEEGTAISEEDQTTADEQMTQLQETLESQGIVYQDWLDQQCISDTAFRKLNMAYYQSLALEEKYAADGKLDPEDAEMDAFLEEQGIYNAKHILVAFENSTGTDETTGYPTYSDAEKAAKKAEAEELLAQIRAAGDPAAKFDELMNAYSDDGRDEEGNLYYPDGYLAYSGQMVAEFEEGALALAEGEISEPIETVYGYHIILRLDADTPDTRSLYSNYAMSNLMDGWLENAVVETNDAFAALDPKAFYDKIQQLNEARQAKRDAEAAAQESAAPEETGTPEESGAPEATGTPAGSPAAE